MSEEEKKAIEYCKKFVELTNKWAGKEKTEMSISFETILNLIEKQQKEIERFNNELDLDYVDKNFIPKDKIKEEINRIDHDIKKTKEILNKGNRFTTYVNCYRKIRLKAFITKLKEIKGRLEKLLEE